MLQDNNHISHISSHPSAYGIYTEYLVQTEHSGSPRSLLLTPARRPTDYLYLIIFLPVISPFSSFSLFFLAGFPSFSYFFLFFRLSVTLFPLICRVFFYFFSFAIFEVAPCLRPSIGQSWLKSPFSRFCFLLPLSLVSQFLALTVVVLLGSHF